MCLLFRMHEELSVSAMAKLMGHDIHKWSIKGISASNARHMLGHGIHVGSMGLCMSTLIASLNASEP